MNDGGIKSLGASDGVWRVGEVVDGLYEILGKTQGGMGAVYRVRHLGWNVELAVKTQLPELVADPAAVRNFETEAQTWVELGLHPHIVSCAYVRRLGGLPRVFAEWVDDGSLAEMIASAGLYTGTRDEILARILDVAIQFAWGLDYAHSQGLVHQDVKPANVMLSSDGTVKVTDFGLAKARAAAGETPGAAPGLSVLAGYGGMTPAYCSPEQAQVAHVTAAGGQSTPLTRATDAWSWAISVWQMFCGAPPVHRGQVAAESFTLYREDPWSEDDRIPEMPKPIAELLGRCLDPDPATRPRRLGELADELIALYGDLTSGPYPRLKPEPARLVADGLNNQALSMVDLGHLDQAAQLWRQALAADPHHLHVSYNHGLHRWRRGEITDGELISALEALRDSHPGGPDLKRLIAQVHIERYDTTTARTLLAEAAREAPADRDVAAALAVAKTQSELGPPRTLAGHTGQVCAVSVSADGRIAVSAGSDETVRVWEVRTGRCLHTLTGHTGLIAAVAISADGRTAITGGADRALRVWEVATGRCLFTLGGHTDVVLSVAISADGRFAVSGSTDETVRAWDLTARNCLHTLKCEGRGPVLSVALSADGRIAVSGKNDETVRVWDLANARCLHGFATDLCESVALSADGGVAVLGGEDTSMAVVDLTTGQQICNLAVPDREMRQAAISGDGRIAASGDTFTVRVWDVRTGVCRRTLGAATGQVYSMALSADGRVGVSCSGQAVQVWDVPIAPGRRAQWSYLRPQTARDVIDAAAAVDAAARRAGALLGAAEWAEAAAQLRAARAVPGHQRNPRLVELWRQLDAHGHRGALQDAWARHNLTGERFALGVALSADGGIAVTLGADRKVRVWDVGTGECLHILASDGGAVALSADGRVAVTCHGDPPNQILRVWQLSTATCAATIALTGESSRVRSMVLSADGLLLVAGNSDDAVWWWNLRTGDSRRILSDQPGGFVTISGDGRIAVTGLADHTGATLRAWDLSTGRWLHTLTGGGAVYSVALNRNGSIAVSGCADGTLRVWDPITGQSLGTLTGHTAEVWSVALSEDGRTAVSGGQDHTVRVWDTTAGQCLHTLAGQTAVNSVALSSDAAVAVTAHRPAATQVWTLDWQYEFGLDAPAVEAAQKPAGWYPDPRRAPPAVRYFDGQKWTRLARPHPDSPPRTTADDERLTEALDRAQAGDVAGAVGDLENLVAHQVRALGHDDCDTLTSRGYLAYCRGRAGDLAGAIRDYESLAVDQTTVLGPDDLETLRTLGILASHRFLADDVVGAIRDYEKLLPDRIRILGLHHRETRLARINLARCRRRIGDVAGAIGDCEKLVPDIVGALGADHPQSLEIRSDLAGLRADAGDVAGAIRDYEGLIEDMVGALDPDDPLLCAARTGLDRCQTRAGVTRGGTD